MVVLLTGGAGYIGSHTCLELLNQGYDVISVDNYCNASPEALRRVRELSGRDVKEYRLDLRDKQALRRVFEENKIDACVHFAGLKAVGESVSKPLDYYDNNLISTINLLELMAQFDVRNLVFSSSATVYGRADTMPLDESLKTWCYSPYGWTKFMIEQILRDAAFANQALSVVLLRYFNPVGAHPSGRIGEDPLGIPNNLIPFVTKVAIGELPKLVIYGNDYNTPDGTCRRDYIHVCDLAKGHVDAIRYCDSHTGCEAINLGTGVPYSVLEIVNSFMRVNQVDVPYSIGPRRPGDVDECWASTEKARRLLGWKAEKGLDDMTRDAWRWQQLNPKGYHG